MSQNVQGNQQTRTLKQTDTHDSDPQYHQVWRISSYEPDFPLPPPSSYSIGIDSPAQPRFEGNPLQKLPQSQRATGDAPYRTRVTVNEYPYPANDKNSSTGDWIINIPETYPSAQERTSVAESRSHRRSKPASGSDSRKYTTHPITPKHHEWDAPPVIERAIHAASISMIQTLQVPIKLYDNLHKIYYPPPNRPNIIKAYPIRRRLPARIFFPTQHDLTSPILLPTLFTIHGGTFTLGSPQDDDVWNRTFSDSNSTLVIALNYSKSPWTSFPTPLQDVEAIYHAALNDDSLPIDRMRTAILGFDAGGNLALALSQLPSVKSGIDPHGLHVEYPCNPPPSAVISVCAILDFTASASEKAKTRPYKNNLKGIRGWGPGLDWVAKVLPSSAWSYIPYGQDVTDPLLSPVYSAREDLPPHVFVVAAELDCLAHESWRAATSWSGGRRAVPSGDEVVGRKEIAVWRGCLDDGRGRDASRFQWMEEFDGTEGKGSTSWLLVPDVVHGFDSAGWRNKYLWGDEEARMDAEMKTVAYQREIGEWLWGIVWR
ncbi:Alpha/Beta hydrolase protein [Cladorrhinum sp. PSN259]|nr:Alpha/Beta hydrolase protein [Cladorrhinum sp. PSN259]